MNLSKITRLEIGLLLVLFVAAALRLFRPALYEMPADEIWIQVDAVRLARHGEWTWIGNPTSMNTWLFHSPLSVYLAAFPYLFTPDVVGSRIVYGLLGTVTVGGLYVLMQRYFGRTAALLASLMLAVNPLAVYWSRVVWNPNAGPPFIVLWMLTGLLGYYEGKRWAQVGHWLMLSGFIQAQTALAMMLPVSVGLALYDWRFHPGPVKAKARTLLLALGLTALSLVPWMIGLLGVQMGWIEPTKFHDMGLSATRLIWPEMDVLTDNVTLITASATYHIETLALTDHPADWWPDKSLNTLLRAQAVIVVLSGVYYIWRGLRNHPDGFPALFLSVVLFWPFFYLFYTSQMIPDFYMMPAVYASAVIFGITFGRLWNWHRLAGLVAVVFIAGQAWLTLALLDRQQRSDQVLSLSELQTIMRGWIKEGHEIVALDEPSDETSGNRLEWLKVWQVMGEQFPTRVVLHPHAIPIGPSGAAVVSAAAGRTIPTYFGEGDTVDTPKRRFRWVVLTPDDLPAPTYRPAAQDQFGSLARINGILTDQPPQAGTVWPVTVAWSPLGPTRDTYQFSVRLVDESGTTYGQVDGTSLEPALWRAGDIVLTHFELPVNDTLPDSANCHIALLLYSWPTITNQPVVDGAGNPVGVIMPLTQ